MLLDIVGRIFHQCFWPRGLFYCDFYQFGTPVVFLNLIFDINLATPREARNYCLAT